MHNACCMHITNMRQRCRIDPQIRFGLPDATYIVQRTQNTAFNHFHKTSFAGANQIHFSGFKILHRHHNYTLANLNRFQNVTKVR